MSCGIDDALKLCIVPSDEEQLLGEANPARVTEVAVGEDKPVPSHSPQTIIESPQPKEVPTISAEAPTGLRSVPSDALHNLLLYCGPQSVTTGLGSTSKHYRSLCLTSGDSDAVWKMFFKWRCSSKLVLGNASRPTTSVRSVTDHQDEQSDELMPSRATAARRRGFQSSARLSAWNASSKSFENGKLSPDEPYYSIYRRLHLDGKKRENKAGVRCNRRRAVAVFQPNGEATIATAADGDPTLQEIQAELMQDLADLAADIHGFGRVCNSDAIEWCDSPSCRRGRCGKCLVPSAGEARHFTAGDGHRFFGERSANAFLGNFTSKCDFCAITLCKFAHGCAENNLRHCDSCNRGVCLDCEHIVSNNRLGVVRRCKGRNNQCGRCVCWRCARTVGRSKTVESGTDDAGNISGISKLSIDNIVEDDRKMSPSGAAAAMESGPSNESPRRSPVNMNSSGKFQVLPFASEKQFADATGQTLCEGCAGEKVGKLNMYRRLDMSPRI